MLDKWPNNFIHIYKFSKIVLEFWEGILNHHNFSEVPSGESHFRWLTFIGLII